MAIPNTFGSKRDAATFDAAMAQIADTYDLLRARCLALYNGYATATAADFDSAAMNGGTATTGLGATRVAARDALHSYVISPTTDAADFNLNQFRNVGR